MAIEKMTLLKLNKLEELKTIDYEYRNSPEAAYKRAWEIVSDIERTARAGGFDGGWCRRE